MALMYISCKDKKEAGKISRHLLKKRLVACSNMFPIESLYWWKGRIANSKEYAILAKVLKKNVKSIRKEVKKIHSYEIPCVIDIDAGANKDFLDWVRKETR